MSKSFEPCWIDEMLCFDTDQRPRNRKQLKEHLPPIVYIEPTPEEAEFLRRERELFDQFAFGDLLAMIKQESERKPK